MNVVFRVCVVKAVAAARKPNTVTPVSHAVAFLHYYTGSYLYFNDMAFGAVAVVTTCAARQRVRLGMGFVLFCVSSITNACANFVAPGFLDFNEFIFQLKFQGF